MAQPMPPGVWQAVSALLTMVSRPLPAANTPARKQTAPTLLRRSAGVIERGYNMDLTDDLVETNAERARDDDARRSAVRKACGPFDPRRLALEARFLARHLAEDNVLV